MKERKFKVRDIVFFPATSRVSGFAGPEDCDYELDVGFVVYELEKCPWYNGMEWMRKLFLRAGYKYAIGDLISDCGEGYICGFKVAKEEELCLYDQEKYCKDQETSFWKWPIFDVLNAFGLFVYKGEKKRGVLPYFVFTIAGISNDVQRKGIIDPSERYLVQNLDRYEMRIVMNSYYEPQKIKWIGNGFSIWDRTFFFWRDEKNIIELRNKKSLESIEEGRQLFEDKTAPIYADITSLTPYVSNDKKYGIKFTSQFKEDIENAKEHGFDLKEIIGLTDYLASFKLRDNPSDWNFDGNNHKVRDWRFGDDFRCAITYEVRYELSTIMFYRVGTFDDLFTPNWK